MGIYPDTKYDKKPDGTIHQTYHVPGLDRITILVPIAVVEVRTDCFCCSCPEDRPGGDPACRNHGWAAKRPCEVHEMPGSPWGDEIPRLDGVMPDSVQAANAARQAV